MLVFHQALVKIWLVLVQWKSYLDVGLTYCAKALRVIAMDIPYWSSLTGFEVRLPKKINPLGGLAAFVAIGNASWVFVVPLEASLTAVLHGSQQEFTLKLLLGEGAAPASPELWGVPVSQG